MKGVLVPVSDGRKGFLQEIDLKVDFSLPAFWNRAVLLYFYGLPAGMDQELSRQRGKSGRHIADFA